MDLVGSLSQSGGIGALLALHDTATNEAYLPSYDGNGNVAVMIDVATGALKATYEYSPFGQFVRKEGTYANANPIRFSTKYTDEETDLVYYGRRYYDAKDGRFVGRDPIEEKGGINLYAFVANNTVNTWDYLGMHRMKPHVVTGTKGKDQTWSSNPFFWSGGGTWDPADYYNPDLEWEDAVDIPEDKPKKKEEKEKEDKEKEKNTDCEDFVNELVDLVEFDTPWYGYYNERASVGYGMMSATWYDQKFWSGTQYHPGFEPGQLGGGDGTKVNYPVTGFRPELVDHGQNSDVMKHVLGHAGAQVANSVVSLGVAYWQNWTNQNDADGGRLQSQVELLNDQVGEDIGRSMVRTIDGSQSKAELKQDLMNKLCATRD